MNKPLPRFDISWIKPPTTRGGDDEDYGPLVIHPAPCDQMPREKRDAEDRMSASDRRVLTEMRSASSGRMHVVDLAARTGVEFEAALRSVLRLVARRQLVIEQRDPLADDHLVRLSNTETDG